MSEYVSYCDYLPNDILIEITCSTDFRQFQEYINVTGVDVRVSPGSQ